MAEEIPYFSEEKQPHAIEPGSFTLDLYRLICMVSADQKVAKHGITSRAIDRLQAAYFRSEVTRILISSAAGLRIQFDQSPEEASTERKSDCGKLFSNWATDTKNWDVLSLREACNKIIHATDIRFDRVIPSYDTNPDEEGAYHQPYLYMYGSKGRDDWRAVLSLIDFTKWGTAAFLGWLPPEGVQRR